MMIFMALVATISFHSLSAMERNNPDMQNFYVMETNGYYMEKAILKKPEKLCALICRFIDTDYKGYGRILIQDLKSILAQDDVQLGEVKDESGRTVLQNTCFMQGRYQAAAPIILELVNDDQLFKLLAAQDNIKSTILHYAAING